VATDTAPAVIDETQVLAYVNTVRDAIGLEALAELPLGVPDDACNCVLGRSWQATVFYDGGVTYEDGPISACFRLESTQMTKAAAAALDVPFIDVDPDLEGGAMRLSVDHPLLVWMWEFDHGKLGAYVDG
jgi:hypothetical protein